MGGLKAKLGKLEKTMRGNLGYFELRDGRRYYFDPQEAWKITFGYFADSMDADYLRVTRPEPPDLLKAVADARDRSAALSLVMDGGFHLPVDREALVECGEFVPRSLVAGKTYEDLGIEAP